MKRSALVILLATILLGLAFGLTTRTAPADDGPDFEYDIVVVRAFFDDPQMVYDLTAWKEPWDVDYNKGFITVGVTPVEYEVLEAAGFRLEVDATLSTEFNRPHEMLPDQVSGIPGYPCYRTVEETYATAEDIVANFPELATWNDVGDSWEKVTPGGNPGYDMMVLQLTNSTIPGPKPKMFVMTSLHAREYTPAETNTRFAEYLVQNYGDDPDITWLLDHHEIHLMLLANPDGRKHAEAGILWRKNTNENYCSPTSTLRGADLNRNFEFLWNSCSGCSSGNQCSETYRGPSAASEPETQTVQNYVRSQFPDQRGDPINAGAPITATGVFFDIHSSGGDVLWPWGALVQPAPNGTALQTFGRKLAYFNNYEPRQAWDLYPTDGATDDFAYGDLGLAAYTFELGTQFFQDCGSFENTILPDNLQALLFAAKVVRTPYLTPAGPDTLNVLLDENVVTPGIMVDLAAIINDTRYNNQSGTEPVQNIAAAEFYIDAPPWVTSTVPISVPMTATDGNFNNPIEAVEGSIDTTGLANGRHIIYVRGRDAAGNWGPFSATFLFVIDPDVAPTIEGEVRAADSNAPLEATVSAGTHFHTNTDPISGYYQMQVISGTYDLTATPNLPGYAPRTIPGIVAQDFQTVEVDFALYPYCDVIYDDVESGPNGWTADSPWAITTEDSHSPTHSWTDSPGGNYGINRDISLTSPVFDLTDYEAVSLNFWQLCDTESGYDYCNVEVSNNGGASWDAIASWDGPSSLWENITLSLPALNNQPNAQIRFRFTSDGSVSADGWHVDDIRLYGAGPECIIPTAPAASFESSSPDPLGTTTVFTNTSTGTNLSFVWDFGDNSPTSSQSSPTHVYPDIGTYTVTLTATNNLGSDVTTGLVEIIPRQQEPTPVYLPIMMSAAPLRAVKP